MNTKKRFAIFAAGLCFSMHLNAQEIVKIKEVEVSAARSNVNFSQAARNVSVISREEIEKSPAKNLNELLEFASNVDIRQRGQNGIQADVSVRGSSFEQVLILLNGIKMTDPQTGHHAMNLPIDLLDIERIEILHGGAARVYGPGAFAGSINIITKDPETTQAKVQLLTGQFGLTQLGASVSVVEEKHNHTLSWTNQQSDGFIRNTDHEMQNIFWQSAWKIKKSEWKLNLGQNEKEFGAQNFYTARFPDQFEATKTQFASLSGNIKKGQLSIEPRGYIRRHNDRFELFREDEGYYTRLAQGGFANNFGDTISWYNGHNYHQTDVYGAELNLAYQSKLGVTSIGLDFRREEILSNVLGEPLTSRRRVRGEDESAFFLRGEDRENRSLFLEHNYSSDQWFVSVGALLNANTDFDDEEIYPGVDVSYQATDVIRPYASVNKSFRFPTYTDLYYNLGGAVGSINLKPEESVNYEAGFKYNHSQGFGHVAVFRRDGSNLIDWIRFAGSDTTRAANLTEVVIDGVEVDYISTTDSWVKEIPLLHQVRLGYAYLYSSDNSDGFESNYVLDFLQHKADLNLQFKLSEWFYLYWNMSFQERKGEFVDVDGKEREFKGIFLSDLKLSTQQKDLNVFLQVSNVFNERYFDIGNVENPGRWISAGLQYNIR